MRQTQGVRGNPGRRILDTAFEDEVGVFSLHSTKDSNFLSDIAKGPALRLNAPLCVPPQGGDRVPPAQGGIPEAGLHLLAWPKSEKPSLHMQMRCKALNKKTLPSCACRSGEGFSRTGREKPGCAELLLAFRVSSAETTSKKFKPDGRRKNTAPPNLMSPARGILNKSYEMTRDPLASLWIAPHLGAVAQAVLAALSASRTPRPGMSGEEVSPRSRPETPRR